MAAFLFARALNRTEEFRPASNVGGAGYFSDAVFRYKLRYPDIWKTCFIQLKHKKEGSIIQRSSLTEMSGDFNLLKYYKSFCEIRNNAATDRNLKKCGPFCDFEFVIYTNAKMESKFPLQGGHSDPLSILSSGTEYGKYITFDETIDKDIFEFYEGLFSRYNTLIGELRNLLESKALADKVINKLTERLQESLTDSEILEEVNSLNSKEKTDNIRTWIDEQSKYDFTLFREFFSKVKIFQSQSNEESFKALIEKELQGACKAPPSRVSFIYTKFEECFSKWWEKEGNVVWLNENSELWQTVQKYRNTKIKEISESEIQENVGCGIGVSEKQVHKLSDAITQNPGALPKFRRRPGSLGLHSELYRVKTAEFLFARALNRAQEFRLASNVDGAGDFGDLVFRYKLREPDIWKTCFIQLKHKINGGTIQRSSLTQMSGDFSLLVYFKSFCEIKNKAATERNLKQCGPFVDFEFVIYTNVEVESNSPLQGGDSDPLSILSSGTDKGKYITFDEKRDTDIFGFFEELPKYHELIKELDSVLKGGTSVDKDFKELDSVLKGETSVDKDFSLKIEDFRHSVTNKKILEMLDCLKSNLNNYYVFMELMEVPKCDFTLYKEFLSKVKIFQSQSNEESLKGLSEQELQQACKASPSVVSCIYTKFEEGFSTWWKKEGNVVWLNENSRLMQDVQKHIKSEIYKISQPEFQEIVKYDICFNQQQVQKLSDVIKQNTVLNIVTKSKMLNLQKLKIFKALNILGYKDLLFIHKNSLINPPKEINKFWPCKWHKVLVVDCGSDGNVAHKVLKILQQGADCGQGLDSSDENTLEILEDVLQKYQQKVVLISTLQKASGFQVKLRNISDFEDNCDISDLDKKSQKKILETLVNFQGTNVALSTLVGTDPPKSMKRLLDSDIISTLISNEHELSIGRQLCDHPKYYVQRVLQHQIYLKEDILKQQDCKVTFAVSGLQADELKRYLPAGEKICEFVYDERGRNHTFKIVSDFSKTGLSAEYGTMKTHKHVGEEMKSDDNNYKIFGSKNAEYDDSEGTKNNFFSSVAKFSRSGLSAELDNMKAFNEEGQNVNPEEVRYIILRNIYPEGKFRELKKLYNNIHWIHVEEGSFLWKDTKGNIVIIRKYIDNTKCKKYNMENVMEHNDRTMLLVAEPGMGKSTFLSCMAHEIKKWKPSVWVLRINLNEHTNDLKNFEFEEESIEKCKEFLWNAAHSPEQDALNVTKEIFLQALEQTGKMVIILDGFDEISPDYSPKVEILIRVIRDETASKIWISSRFSYRQKLENILGKFAFTLQPFTKENQIQFLEQYWSEVTGTSKQENLQKYVKILIDLCPQNFSDKNGEFTGTPLQTMMLGEAFVNEAKESCCSAKFKLPEKFNLLYLFEKFTEKKFDVYFREKNKMDNSNLEVKKTEKTCLEEHMISSLISLFSLNEVKWLLRDRKHDLKQAEKILISGTVQHFGIVRDITEGKPQFIHRCFAEYFAAKWLTDNFRQCEDFISRTLFNSTYEVTRNIFDRMLAEHSEIHNSVLNNDIHVLEELLKKETNINTLDKGGRTALHLAASYNSPYIQLLLSFPDIDTNRPDEVLKWTPLRYACRTKSWMAMDILLQNGANPDDIVFTTHNAKTQKWGQAGMSVNLTDKDEFTPLRVSAQFGNLEVTKALVEGDAAINSTNTYGLTPLMVAAQNGKLQTFRYLTKIGADINVRDTTNDNTALHYAAASGSVDIISLLLVAGMSVNLCNTKDSTPLHVSAEFDHLEATKALVQRGAAINNANKYGLTPLMVAAQNGKLETFRYLTNIGADINVRDTINDNNTALHYAAASGSVDIINLLLDKRMSVNLCNTNDFTPLHVSAEFGHLEATKALVERGANRYITNKYGDTPLSLATRKNRSNICCFLIDVGDECDA